MSKASAARTCATALVSTALLIIVAANANAQNPGNPTILEHVENVEAAVNTLASQQQTLQTTVDSLAAVLQTLQKGRELFRAFKGGRDNGSVFIDFGVVPAGKRLVIEHVSAQAQVGTPGQVINAALSVGIGTELVVGDIVPFQLQGNVGSSGFYAASVQTKFVANPGEDIFFSVFSGGSSVVVDSSAFLSGYYVPAE